MYVYICIYTCAYTYVKSVQILGQCHLSKFQTAVWLDCSYALWYIAARDASGMAGCRHSHKNNDVCFNNTLLIAGSLPGCIPVINLYLDFSARVQIFTAANHPQLSLTSMVSAKSLSSLCV